MTIPTQDITGLVLAGGRGSRMGGVDKGLQSHHGTPLALHALLRLGPQVGQLMINANRNLGAYESMGVPVWPDALADYPGPLAGFLAGLERCETPYLVTVPCDTPNFPADLVERLATALQAADAEIAIAATLEDGVLQPQPVFCLMKSGLMESLVAFTQSGQRKIDRWTAQHRCVTLTFDDAAAFANANTPDELQRLQQSEPDRRDQR
jgi:molybdenum cofactor guanylyltransferase